MIVLKIGGDLLDRGLGSSLSADIKRTLETDRIVIVHGGGDEVTKIAERLGKKQSFVSSPEGIRSRYTDKETAEIYNMVMAGKINKEVVAFLLKEGVPAVGLSGVDAGLLKAKRKKRLIIVDEKGRKKVIEGGFTGKIDQVNSVFLRLLIENGHVPVIAPTALGEEHELLNVDSDRAAANIGGAMGAEKIVFLTDVQGILMDGKLVKRLSVKEAETLLPKIGLGMEKKLIASIEALKAGVKKAIIASGLAENPISNAINRNAGTVICPE